MNDTENKNSFVGYTFEAPTLPSIETQCEAIGSPETVYIDSGRMRKRRRELKFCIRALKTRGGETLAIATAGVLGSGKPMLALLRQLSGHHVKLHVADIDQTFDLDVNAVELAGLLIRAKQENVARRAEHGGLAASARSGRKPKLNDETKAEADEMYRMKHRSGDWMYSIEDVASKYGVSSITIKRNLGDRREINET